MSERLLTREECVRNLRDALDRARAERNALYAAGRLPEPQLSAFERLLATQARREAAAPAAA